MESGTYLVDDKMVDFLLHRAAIDHPSNLAAPIGLRLSEGRFPCSNRSNLRRRVVRRGSFVRPSSTSRISRLHALNMKAAARQIAFDLGRDVRNLNLVIAHLGGGISVGLQLREKMVDVNNATDEDLSARTELGASSG